MWIIRLVAFIYIGWRVGKTYGEAPPLASLAGTIAGLIIGLAAALLRLSGGFRVWKLFNLITETTLAAIVGCLAVFLVVYLWDFWPKKFTGNK
jgi:ABC-type amino acid transport system permease subunit